MKAVVIGLGSMGKRRVRNLQALNITEIAGVDVREDRRTEAAAKYGVAVYAECGDALDAMHPDVLVISTPPDLHMTYAWAGLERGMSCFIEASVVDADRILELHHLTIDSDVLMAPSCTMRYYPGPRRVAELIRGGAIGRPLIVNYQTGQYLPDWHPWEPIQDYYVSRRATGGAREIVPFELTWLNDLFGRPEPLACVRAKLSDLPADIDDVYHCLLRYPDDVLASLTVEVISRPTATRELRVLGSEGTIVFSADERCVRHVTTGGGDWERFSLDGGTVETGYINPEEPYIAEMRDFVAAVEQNDRRRYPNTLLNDYHSLQALYRLEDLSTNPR